MLSTKPNLVSVSSSFTISSPWILLNVMFCWWILCLAQVSVAYTIFHFYLSNSFGMLVAITNWYLLAIELLADISYCVVSAGNSANQAIELLIRKGVPEDRIIFLNLISVKFLSWVIHWLLLLLSNLSSLLIVLWWTGPWRSSLCLQALPSLEDYNLRDWCWIERGISGHPWAGRVRRPLLRHWLTDGWYCCGWQCEKILEVELTLRW
jgi:hypothetical protein